MKDLLKSKDWQELKSLLIEEFIERPYEINTDGKSMETIVLDYKANEIACKKVKRFIAKIERMNQEVPNKTKLEDFI